MSKIPTVMALFHSGLLTENEVISWADKQLDNDKEPIDYVFLLSLKGPKHCSKLSSNEFPVPRVFTFIEEFALRTRKLDIKSVEEKTDFIQWISTACMGLDIDTPEVSFGYHIDHYFFECDNLSFADKYLLEQLKILTQKNAHIAQEIWSEIA